jgi:hypothetical protein
MTDPTAAGPSLESIVQTLSERRKYAGVWLDNARAARDAYNGDIVIPMPELDRNEKPAVINLINTTLDQTAMRVASTLPDLYYPPLRFGFKQSEDKARTLRRANLAWWEMNKIQQKMRRRARQLLGYGTTPVLLRPNMKTEAPHWHTRDALNAFPCPTGDPDDMTPPDCIFTFTRSYGWLVSHYPDKVNALRTGDPFGKKPDPAMQFDMIEYHDDAVTVLAVLGNNVSPGGLQLPSNTPGAPVVELERIANRTGMCLVVAPKRITLDRPMGQFDGMLGMYQMMAKLTALEIIAVERGIFPETYLVSRPNETARFLAGPYDGRSGLVNIVAGGDIKETTPNPGFATTNTVDRIERAARASSGAAAEFGGESPSNVRTGKRGDAVMSAIVDFPVQEAQEILAQSLVEENKRAVAIAKTYFGNQRKSFYVSTGKRPGHVDYVPNRDFETDVNRVTYPHAGADANALVIGLGQRVGMGTLSTRSAMEIDPMIADPELEEDRIVAEGLQRSLLTSLEQQAAQGALPPHDLARIQVLVAGHTHTLAEAVDVVQKEAQARQATPAPEGTPETQPGIAQPDQGAEQPSIQPPGASQTNLADLLNSLRRPTRETPQEKGAA